MSSLTAAEQIDKTTAELADWRGTRIAQIRRLIREAQPDVSEAIKWRGAPVWSRDGDICVVGAFKGKVKLTFPNGAHLPDPDRIFNNGLGGKQWRAIDIFEKDAINEEALKAMVRSAVAYNQRKPKAGSRSRSKS